MSRSNHGSPGRLRCPAVHMMAMKITAYMNLSPEHVFFDERKGALSLTRKAFAASVPVYPTAEMAAANESPDATRYTVKADFDDSTVFEVLGLLEGVGKTFGTYTAGFFWDYADAFEASAGLGAGGGRGEILVRPEITEIFDDVASWKARFNIDTVASGPRSQDRIQMRRFVDIVGITA
ncbi:MAG TPA: hypothetical protein VF867_00020 [Arthrobacter sp.]